jgi:hypothetical protein
MAEVGMLVLSQVTARFICWGSSNSYQTGGHNNAGVLSGKKVGVQSGAGQVTPDEGYFIY